MSNNISSSTASPFERIKKVNNHGYEYWSARELMSLLEYSDYRNFVAVIKKSMKACQNSGENISNHFGQVNEMVDIGSNTKRNIENYHLSRYACYLIVQNADPTKEIVATGQSYFAIQTRKQEVFEQSTEDQKRLFLRKEMKSHNTKLADAAHKAGVIEPLDFAIFQNHGYKGLYGGLDAKAIRDRKGLKKSQDILDYMGSTELAANLFRATQTEEKLRRDGIKGKDLANKTHYEVGKKVRKTIEDLGGTMPEDLPTVKSIKDIEKERRKLSKSPIDEINEIVSTYEFVAPSSESTISNDNRFIPDAKWEKVINGLKNQGRMVLYANMLNTKAIFNKEILYICLSGEDGFRKLILSKSENIDFLEEYLSKALDINKIKIKLINDEDIDNLNNKV